MGDAGNAQEAQITLYTNHGCPWAHRAHVAVKELGLSYEEVIIDLSTARPEWYLKINPRGLVPAMVYKPAHDEAVTVIESGLVVQFLIDAYPKLSTKLLPPPTSSENAYARYRINFFVDTYFNKVHPFWFKALVAAGTPEVEEKSQDLVKAVETHIEPLLHDAKPFFGGSSHLTLAEVQTASFVLRLYDFSDSNGRLHPASLKAGLNKLPNFGRWAKATVAHESVTFIWEKQAMIERTANRLPAMKEKFAAAAK